MHIRAGERRGPDQVRAFIHADMALVTVSADAVFLGPARLRVHVGKRAVAAFGRRARRSKGFISASGNYGTYASSPLKMTLRKAKIKLERSTQFAPRRGHAHKLWKLSARNHLISLKFFPSNDCARTDETDAGDHALHDGL